MLASASAHLLTSLDVGDDPVFGISDVMVAALPVLGPNLIYLGLGSEAVFNMEDWDNIVFAHCKNLRSLALHLDVCAQYILEDPYYTVECKSLNVWYCTGNLLKHMLVGSGVADGGSGSGPGDELRSNTEGDVSGSSRKHSTHGRQDASGADDEGSEDDGDYDWRTTFAPGVLHSIMLKLTAHCDSDVCTCTDDELQGHFVM